MFNNGWTPERRARQAALISVWRPWEKATGPTTAKGKATASRNSYKGGVWKAEREELRALKQEVSATLQAQRELLAWVERGADDAKGAVTDPHVLV